MSEGKPETEIRQSEIFVRALANRYGFRARDFSLVWDDGEFEASRSVHRLNIVSADGRRSSAEIPHNALMRQDPWKYIREVDSAFMDLARRGEVRGI